MEFKEIKPEDWMSHVRPYHMSRGELKMIYNSLLLDYNSSDDESKKKRSLETLMNRIEMMVNMKYP